MVIIYLKATCVLVKPNPVKSGQQVSFWGNGIVPQKTEITVYTISGEKIWQSEETILWDYKDKDGKPLLPGIYIYTYRSSKEQGIGNFTVIK